MRFSKAEIEAIIAASPRLHVPYNKLVLSQDYQARPEGSRPRLSIAELSVSIRETGVLQNLVVVKGARGLFEVCAGGRRLEALASLVAVGDIPENYPVPVLLVPADKALIASLAENVCREPLSVAEELAGFLRLSEQGKPVEDIAAAFGVTPLVVKRRLKLAAVSPRLMDLFREEKIGPDCLMALASVDDHEKQEQAWAGLQPWNRHPEALRRLLNQGEIESDRDPAARYVTVKAYEKAGGPTRRDLFSDDEKKVYLLDAVLLERLAVDKLQKKAKQLAAEGWKWVEVRVRFDHEDLSKYGHLRKTRREPTPEEASQLVALREKLAGLNQQIDALADDDQSDEADGQLQADVDAVHAQLSAMEEALTDWPSSLVPLAGCVVYVGERGTAAFKQGLVRPEDRAGMLQASQKTEAEGPGASHVSLPSPRTRPVHSKKLTRRLTAHRVCAVQAELLARSDVALAVITAQLAAKLLQDGFHGYDCADNVLTVSASETHQGLRREADDMSDSAGWKLVDAQRAAWIERLPKQAGEVFAWVLQQDRTTVEQLLAFLVATSVCGVCGVEREEQSTDALALALGLDMNKWWRPTAAAYLNHVPKARVIEVVAQAAGAGAASPLATLKKDAAVTAAEQAVANTSWLPECLRTGKGSPVSRDDPEGSGRAPTDGSTRPSREDVAEDSVRVA
jgi:ParB family transcriptional regulator, chromosome partitioning protein